MGTTATALALVCLTVGSNPTRELPAEQVDLIEVNHFHDDQGRPVFDQILFYDWSAIAGRYQVRDWRLLKSPNQIPLPNAEHGEFVAVWNDFKARDTLRTTKAKVVRETWTRYDPELIEREFLPENKRRKLRDATSSTRLAKAATASGEGAAGTAAPRSTGPLRPLQSPAPDTRNR